MFKSLTIENVQSHLNTYMEFHDGVNMVIGESDKGKSAIFNSIYKAIYNNPTRGNWRSWWSGDSLIDVELEEYSITYMNNGKGSYTITDKNNKETVFNAFGNGPPPDEVSALFNMDKKINVQQQLERGVPIFLISESPGDVAKFFNKVAGLYKIDTTTAIGKSDVLKTERELNQIKENIKEKKELIVEYNGIEELSKKVRKAELSETKLNEYKLKEISISSSLIKIKQFKDEINKLKNVLVTKKKVTKANTLLDRINRLFIKENLISRKLETIKDIKKDIECNKEVLKINPKINEAIKVFTELQLTNDKKIKIDTSIHKLKSIKTDIDRLSEYQTKTSLILKKIMPKICPLCGK